MTNSEKGGKKREIETASNMNDIRKVIRIFLASASDVATEREVAIAVIREMNEVYAKYLGYVFELIVWEDMIPGMGRPQQVILEQARFEDLDIFVGILWNRFGTPTGIVDSGTEEEFNKAYEFGRNTGRPHIMFYFCEKPHSICNDNEIDQRAKVIKFRKKMERSGLIYGFYDLFGERGFEKQFRQHLFKHLSNLAGGFCLSIPT